MPDLDLGTTKNLAVRAAALEHAWCAAVDTNDLDAIQSLFAPGGEFFTRDEWMDADRRDAFFTTMWAQSPSRSTHVCRDVRAETGAEGIRITALLSATFILPDGSIRLAWGNYDDRAAESPDGLRLVSKKITLARVELYAA